MNDRQEIVDELILREQIRRIIKIVRKTKDEQLNEERELRAIIRKLILKEASEISKKTPHRSTGINVLDQMPNTPDKLAISVIGDPTWWADNGSEISERYGAWMGN